MQSNLEDQAIKAALEGNWDKAIELNHTILQNNPDHIPTLNRLAKAFSQLGQTDDAKAAYNRVLQLDKFNTIAAKNCQSLKNAPGVPVSNNLKIIDTDFIEEPGKTKTIPLVRLGDSKTLLNLQAGQLVNLVPKNHWIAVISQDDIYIGALPENVSLRLKQLMTGGNRFQAVIRTASVNQASIFIKEMFRSPQFANTPSF